MANQDLKASEKVLLFKQGLQAAAAAVAILEAKQQPPPALLSGVKQEKMEERDIFKHSNNPNMKNWCLKCIFKLETDCTCVKKEVKTEEVKKEEVKKEEVKKAEVKKEAVKNEEEPVWLIDFLMEFS